MKLTFFGAAKSVTGSSYLVECGGKRILVDCGLQQGRDERDNRELEFNPSVIDAVVLTHAHIDHSGRLPLLAKLGFRGAIHCTRLTAQLLSIMLRDSAHIQESDAQWENRKGSRAGRDAVEPLYTLADAEAAMALVVPHEYGEMAQLLDGVSARFTDAGHLLGSASAELWLTEGGETRKIVFSGDIGNKNQPIIRDPQYITQADYVVTESTYGGRLHQGNGHYKEDLAAIIDETLSRGGNVIIPSFAVGRTQELLYFIREMKEEGLVKRAPNFQVVVDSPLAREATKIYSGDLHGYLDDASLELVKDGEALFTFPGLTLVEGSEESKALNLDKTPKVILSASGMCDAGRVRHHLKHNLWRSESTVVFVGYQAEGSLGRRLVDGAETVRLFGETIAVKAKITKCEGMSAHADEKGLLEWIDAFSPKPTHVFVTHGEVETTLAYARTLEDRGLEAHAPDHREVYDLLANRVLTPGVPPVPRPSATQEGVSPAFRRLEQVGQKLSEVISRSKGNTNKDLSKFADQLRALIEKWEK